jgi:hypothetical protein
VIFDMLCGVAERQFPPIVPALRRSVLYHFPHDRVWPTRLDVLTEPQQREMWLSFRLPDPYVAVDTSRAVTLVWDEAPESGIEPGMERQRCVLVATLLSEQRALASQNPDPVAKRLRDAAQRLHQEHGDILLVVMGKVQAVLARPFAFSGSVDLAFTAHKDQVIQGNDRLLGGKGRAVMTEAFLRDAGEAYARIHWTTPTETYWRRVPTSKRPVLPGKVARSDQREIREAL